MNTAVLRADPSRDTTRRPARRLSGGWPLRVTLVVACAASAASAWHVGDPTAALLADPVGRLLRGMAVLKGSMVVAAIAVLMWRFAHPIAWRVAAAYVASSALMAFAAAMIWQLTALLPSAVLFHTGLLVAMIVAWRGDVDRPLRSTSR